MAQQPISWNASSELSQPSAGLQTVILPGQTSELKAPMLQGGHRGAEAHLYCLLVAAIPVHHAWPFAEPRCRSR